MKNIVLTGFMGTGKTEVGRELSRLLNMKLIDVDAEIEKTKKMTINEIFRRLGEFQFREFETEIIKKVTRKKSVIISTGGGAIIREENVDALRKNGLIICLTATAETILNRTGNSDDRPLLRADDPLAQIRQLLESRKPFYQRADITIDTEGKSPRQVAEEIIDRLKGKI
ncbi:MAG: shikimate kinase [Nitrospirota bacterium]